MRLLARLAALCCVFLAMAAHARPFTVDDLLKVDRRSDIGASPDGRWLVLSVIRGQAYAPRFEYDAAYPFAARRLYRVDLANPGPATPLLIQEDSAGYTAGAFSPDGQRILVNRLQGRKWETGVVELASGKVRWLGVGADYQLWGRTAQWRTNREIVAIVTPPDEPHFLIRRSWERGTFTNQARLATAEQGGPSVLAIGSGRFLDRGALGPQKSLTMIDVDTGSATVLATGDFQDLEISASGRYVAAWKNGSDLQPRAADSIRGGTALRRRDLVVADLQARKILAGCSNCFLSPMLLAWAPTSDRLLIYARHPGEAVAQGRFRIVTPTARGLDDESLDHVRAAMESTYEGFEIPHAGWAGRTVVVLGRRAGDSEDKAASWLLIDRRGVRDLLPSHVPLPSKLAIDPEGNFVTIGGGKAVRVRGGKASIIEGASIAPGETLGSGARQNLAKLVQTNSLLAKVKGRLVRMDAAGGDDLGPLDSLAISASRDGAVITAGRDGHGTETIQVTVAGAKTGVLVLNPQLAEIDFGDVRPVAHVGPSGEPLTSWIVLPPGWRKDQLPPLVVLPYPGLGVHSATIQPSDSRPGAGLSNISSLVLAGHGYAVLYPSLPRTRYPDDPGKDIAAEILEVVDAVGAAGLADTQRVAIWGHSFGGFAALAAATQSSRFKAIVCTAGVADIVRKWGDYVIQMNPDEGLFFTPNQGYVEGGQMRVGGPPWAVPDNYVRNSPIFHADKITAPVLLAYGDLDAYSQGQGGEMFGALYRQGKDAKLLTFFGEGHVVTAPGNVRRLYGEALGWFDQAFGPTGLVEAGKAP